MLQSIQHTTRSTADLLLWVWNAYLRKHLKRLSLATVFMMLQGASLGILSYLIRPVFDEIFANKNETALISVGLAVLGVFVLRGLSGFCQRVIMSAVGERMKFDLQSDLVQRILCLDRQFFNDNPSGDLIARVKEDMARIQGIWTSLLAPGIRDLMSIIALLYVAVTIDWFWTMVVLAGIPLLTVPVLLLQRLVRKFSLTAAEANADVVTRLEEMFHNIREIKLYRLEDQQIERFLNTTAIVKRASVRAEATIAGVPGLVDVVAGLGFLGLLLIAGRDVISEERTVGQFMSFFTAIVLLFDPVKRLGNLFSAWQGIKVSLERARVVFDATPTILDPEKPIEIPNDIGNRSIEFKNVCLELGSQQIIRNLTFVAEAGKTTAIVGPSGAGKTTVFNLLTRIYDPTSGLIRIGDYKLNELTVSRLRDEMAVVAQDSGIFDETIRENIMLGNQVASEEEFAQAAQAAYVTEFASAERGGFDSLCGPRGESLSGGQRQRVTIARALLRNAPILLLDEATSSLDLESEQIVHEAVRHLAEGRTVLVVAHRLSTIQHADKICVMQDGTIAEEGTHQQLMEQNGLYALLYRVQFREITAD